MNAPFRPTILFLGALLLAALLSSPAHADGGYGGPAIMLSPLNGETALFTGASGAWINKDYYALGGGGWGSAFSPTSIINGERQRIAMGYGGLVFEAFLAPDLPIQPELALMMGAGGVGIIREGDNDGSAFFVAHPAVGFQAEFLPWLHLNAQVGYRYMLFLGLQDLEDDDLNGASISFQIRFGKFDAGRSQFQRPIIINR